MAIYKYWNIYRSQFHQREGSYFSTTMETSPKEHKQSRRKYLNCTNPKLSVPEMHSTMELT